jgi:hypothetical protein
VKTIGLFSAFQPAAPAPSPAQVCERSIDPGCTPETISAWACEAAAELGGRLPESAVAAVAAVAGALTADALTCGRPPLTIQVTRTTAAVDIAVTGARSIAHRTLSHDTPALVEARKLTTSWRTRLGPGGRGSVVTASIPLRPRRRLPRLLRGSR